MSSSPWSYGVELSISLRNAYVLPSQQLHGEVVVTVDRVHGDCGGLRYHRIALELRGDENNGVRDDQGEFDAMLDRYTSKRSYLSRHVTLSGPKSPAEDVETALQVRQELAYRKRHAAPYAHALPERPKEVEAAEAEAKKRRKAAKKAGRHHRHHNDDDGPSVTALVAAAEHERQVQQQQATAPGLTADVLAAAQRAVLNEMQRRPHDDGNNADAAAHDKGDVVGHNTRHSATASRADARVSSSSADAHATAGQATAQYSEAERAPTIGCCCLLCADGVDTNANTSATHTLHQQHHGHATSAHVDDPWVAPLGGYTTTMALELSDVSTAVAHKKSKDNNDSRSSSSSVHEQSSSSSKRPHTAPVHAAGDDNTDEHDAHAVAHTEPTQHAHKNDSGSRHRGASTADAMASSVHDDSGRAATAVAAATGTVLPTRRDAIDNNDDDGNHVDVAAAAAAALVARQVARSDNNNNTSGNDDGRVPVASVQPTPVCALHASEVALHNDNDNDNNDTAATATADGSATRRDAHARAHAKKARCLMPGRYTFPFTFRLPPWLPPSLYYSLSGAYGYIRYEARATIEFGTFMRDLHTRQPFYVLSTISRRQLLACQEEAVRSITVAPMPPLSAQFQVFACSCMGNLCCVAGKSTIEVELLLQSSRALVLADANATYQVFRTRAQQRAEAAAAAAAAALTGVDADAYNNNNDGMRPRRRCHRRRGANNNNDDDSDDHDDDYYCDDYDSADSRDDMASSSSGSSERDYRVTDDNDTSHAVSAIDGVNAHGDVRQRFHRHVLSGYDVYVERRKELEVYGPLRRPRRHQHNNSSDGKSSSGQQQQQQGAVGDVPAMTPEAALYARQQRRALRRQQRALAEAALPLPVGALPLLVRVVNRCTRREVPVVRVELRESVEVFKSLERPRLFHAALARHDYTVAIPPGNETTFAVRLELPRQFRRCKADDDTLLPPPGVRTANFCTSTAIVVSFPGIPAYVEEEDWANGAVQLAEAVDLTDQVLDLPVRYS